MDLDHSKDGDGDGIQWRGIPGNIIIVNAYDPKNEGTATVAHTAVCRTVRQYLRSSSSHYLAVSLYGTAVSSNSDLCNIVDLVPFSVPTLTDYKKLRNANLSSFGQTKDFKMSDVLWHCSKLFANCKKQLSSKTVTILTKLNISPIQSDQNPTFKRVIDLVDSNIEVKIINIAKDEYEIDEFYVNFMKNSDGKDYVKPVPIADVSEISQTLLQLSHRHLATCKIGFEIGEGMTIGVAVYNLLKSQSGHPKVAHLHAETNELVMPVNKTFKVSNGDAMDVDEDSVPIEMPILKSEILYYQSLGGERIEFTDKEMKFIRNPFGPPKLKLLGFKSLALISKEKWYFKHSSFLFPSENNIEGSTVAFKALHKACIDMSMVAICVLCTRINARPFIVALSPCTNPLNLKIDLGFDVIRIPFVENVRDLSALVDDQNEHIKVSPANKTVMMDLVNRLKFEYKADSFENPSKESKMRAIEAIALDEDVEPFVDTTIPDPSKFECINDELFDELFGPFAVTAQKRPAQPRETASKKAKCDVDDATIQLHVQNNTVDKFTVPVLKKILSSKDIPGLPAITGLKKNQLVNLVYKYF